MIYIKYKISELKWFESDEVQPDMLSPFFLDYVRRSSYDRLLVWFSKHFIYKIIAIILILIAVILFLYGYHFISYIVCFLSLVSLFMAYYYYNWWRNNYFMVDWVCAFAAMSVENLKNKLASETPDNTKTE